MHFAVCDDIPKDRLLLCQAISDCFDNNRGSFSVEEYVSGDALLVAIEKDNSRFDAIFLDIYMKGMTGIDLAREIRNNGITVPIVFFTTSSDFAVESYDVDAIGYLLKPVDKDKLRNLLIKIESYVKNKPALIIKKGGVVKSIAFSSIVYVESINHSLVLHLTGNDAITFSGKLDHLAEQMKDNCFLRCHQSYIINMRHVVKLDKVFYMDDGSKVLLRSKSAKQISKQYYNWLMTEMF